MSAFEKITAQQKGKGTGTPAWMVGEQLKDMIRMDPRCEDLLDKDLDVKEMSLEKAAAKIKAFADGHKTGNFACVTPMQADKILREFYGLPGGEERIATAPQAPRNDSKKIVDLADFL